MRVRAPMLILLGLVTLIGFVTPEPQQPHILFLLADDLGWNDVSYHGSEIGTPYIDSLARTGVQLENYYVQPICSPSRSQLMTGRYQIHLGNVHGIMQADKPMGLPLDIPTLAEKLSESGYATHAVGKWHLGMYTPSFLPTRRGFDSFFGKLIGSGDHFNYTRCQMFDGVSRCGYDIRNNEDPVPGVSEYSTHLYTRKALQIIEEHDPSRPLFLYVPFQAPHSPLQVPQEYEDRHSYIADKDRRTYAGMVSCMDDAIQNITEAFKRRGLWDNTVLVFSSDNGGNEAVGASNSPLRAHKGCIFDGGIRSVALVNGGILRNNAGSISNELLHITDWFPTLVNLAGGSTEGLDLDGHDVWETISDGTPSPRDEILHDMDILYRKIGENLYPEIWDTRIRAAIRVGDWKLVTGRPDTSGRPIVMRAEAEAGGRNGGQGGRRGGARGADDATAREPERGDQPGDSANEMPRGRPSPAGGGGMLEVMPRTPADEPDGKNLWLFNMIDDPNETTDVSSDHPEIVERLLRRLSDHLATAVPPVSPCQDPRANPEELGGFWGPWLEAGQENTIEPICENLQEEYEAFRHSPGSQNVDKGGPGSILLVIIVLIFCILLLGTIFAVRKYLLQRKKKIQMEDTMNHE